MWTLRPRGGARTRLRVVGRLAVGRIAIVRTPGPVHARARDIVQRIPNSSDRDSSLGRRQQGRAAVLVLDLFSRLVDVVLEDLRDQSADPVPPLALLAVLQWSIRLRAMDELESGFLALEVTVTEIERTNHAGSSAGVPEQGHHDVVPRRVVVALEVLEDIAGAIRLERRVAHTLAAGDGREGNLGVEVLRDRVDVGAELQAGRCCSAS